MNRLETAIWETFTMLLFLAGGLVETAFLVVDYIKDAIKKRIRGGKNE